MIAMPLPEFEELFGRLLAETTHAAQCEGFENGISFALERLPEPLIKVHGLNHDYQGLKIARHNVAIRKDGHLRTIARIKEQLGAKKQETSS